MATRITRKQMEEQVFRLTGRRHRIPARDSELWPPFCRGDRWRWGLALLYVGRCQMCGHACQPPEGRRRMDAMAFLPEFLLCTDHPDSPGRLRQVTPTQMCRNFRPRHVTPVRGSEVKIAHARRDPRAALNAVTYASDPKVRRIPLSQGLFALVDARDYKKLSQYKWSANWHGANVYACRHERGRTYFMHRQIKKPPPGKVVDHIDGNGLNNCRRNLRVVTPQQNQANKRHSRGTSPYVGASRCRGKWQAAITIHGHQYYLGVFNDPIEAAKARDRKAYEELGPYAYLNFPEDFRKGRVRRRPRR